MPKKFVPYEIKKILFILWCVASAVLLAYGLYLFLWNVLQIGFALIPEDLWNALFEEPSSEKIQPYVNLIKKFNDGLTLREAAGKLVLSVLLAVAGGVSLFAARKMLHRNERKVKQAFLPEILSETFSDVDYSPEKKASEEEPLCRLGLLRSYERYYTANRLEALYRDCWVASEEIICGGVYGSHYTGHKIKVRGQWMTIRLSQSIESTVILEKRNSQNRLNHSKLASSMKEVNFSYEEFAREFRCFAVSPKLAQQLITREVADNLLEKLEQYEDFSLIFDGGNLHILLRRKSFDRRLECLVPYSDALLRKEAERLYRPLCDFTDMLLE